MNRLLVWTALLFLAATAVFSGSGFSASAAVTGDRVALVIGNSAYQAVPSLPNTLKDADLAGKALREAGFSDVTIVKDLGRSELSRALRDFAGKADHADWAVVYYAGHGIEVAGQNFLIPTDARLLDDRDIEDEAVSLDRVLQSVEHAGQVRLVVLDACRNNPFITSMRRSNARRSVDRGLARVEPEDSTLVLFAAKEGMTAADGNGENSPFALSFASRILQPGVELNLVLRYVSDDVAKATANAQRPVFYGTLPPTELYFVPKGADVQPITQASLNPAPSTDLTLTAPAAAAVDGGMSTSPPTNDSSGPAIVDDSDAGEVKIGVAGPLTGPNAAFGMQLKNGAERAVADINAAGGILGKKIVLELGDDVSDPKQGRSVANQFVGDGVNFVVGHFNSGVSIPASEIYAENGILEVTPASTNPAFTERDLWNTFRTVGRDDQQGIVAGRYLAEHAAGQPIAIVSDGTGYGQQLADITKATLNAAGVTEALDLEIQVGEKDYSATIAKMKRKKIKFVYFGGLWTEAGLLVRQASELGLKARFISGDGIVSNEFATIAGPAAAGTLMTFSPEPRNVPAARAVVEAFRAGGFEPEAYTLYAYAAVQLIAEAAKQAGTTDPFKVAATLRNGTAWPTVLGDLAFDQKGDRISLDYELYVWKRGADNQMTYAELK